MNFVFDIDGTICFNGNSISNKIVESIKYAENLGHKIIFASARSYRDCVPVLFPDFNKNIIIGLNGGVCYIDGKLHSFYSIDVKLYKSILNILLKYNLPFFVDDFINYSCKFEDKISFYPYVDNFKIAKKLDFFDIEYPIKIVISLEEKEDIKSKLVDEIEKLGRFDIFYNEFERLLYINPLNINKATTIKKILKNDYICFGNDKNDIDMFKQSIYSVQVGNYELLKNYADECVVSDFVANKIIELAYKY